MVPWVLWRAEVMFLQSAPAIADKILSYGIPHFATVLQNRYCNCNHLTDKEIHF